MMVIREILKKQVFLLCLSLLVFSCTKDVAIPVDKFAGRYSCMEITRLIVPLDSGRWRVQVDTSYHVMVDIGAKSNGSYDVAIKGSFVFNSGVSSTHVYSPGCYSGPCPSLIFYPDSISIFRKVANPLTTYYYGKKQK